MRAEVMEFYGLARSPRAVGYYETAHHRQLLQDIKQAAYDGDLVALCGVVGAGKTVTLRRLQEVLARENRVIVSKAVSIEKNRVTLNTLITALFCDLSPDKEPKIPKQNELRDRELCNLVRKRRKPIVLIVDEAHDLHHHTLTGLKRLIEMVADSDGKLSVLLAGHPKLRRDLRSPTMEEIGYRTTVFSLEGVTGSQREYIEWMLTTCAADTVRVDDILDPAAVDLLAARLRTPLQIEQHLALALETGYQASEKPIGEAIVDSVLSKQIDDLEPTLTPARLHGEGADRDAGHQARRAAGAVPPNAGAGPRPRAEGAAARRRPAGVTQGTKNRSFALPGPASRGRRSSPLPGAISVGTATMIAIPRAAFMRSVAMSVGSAPQARCNERGHETPMIAIPRADDCDPLQVASVWAGIAMVPWRPDRRPGSHDRQAIRRPSSRPTPTAMRTAVRGWRRMTPLSWAGMSSVSARVRSSAWPWLSRIRASARVVSSIISPVASSSLEAVWPVRSDMAHISCC